MINELYSREELRKFARRFGIKRGRDKKDTVNNILDDDRVTITISLEMK
jgi:hypothetical protein